MEVWSNEITCQWEENYRVMGVRGMCEGGCAMAKEIGGNEEGCLGHGLKP